MQKKSPQFGKNHEGEGPSSPDYHPQEVHTGMAPCGMPRDINPVPGDPNGNGSQEEPKVSGNPGGTSGSGTQGTSGTGNTGTPTENGNLQDKEPHGFEEQQEEGSDQKKPEDTGVGPNCNKSKPHKRPTFLSA